MATRPRVTRKAKIMAVDPNSDPFANISVPPANPATVMPITTPMPQPAFVPPSTAPTTTVNPNPYAFSNLIASGGHAEGPSWKIRKRIVYLTLLFCAAIITYVTLKGADTRLNETIIQFSYLLGASTLSSFIFGATWHDLSLNKQQ